ncbi:hypothetical protein BC941DRAFT_517964 [Chlamydoabsidia padenii]|nr:hypothetical protein BC941DRAFT_517964 [Chlamydoabsidia padenii]
MLPDDPKPKRNKPCESCRTHRRRCILQHPNICVRCQRMGLPCLFKFSTKPPTLPQPKKPISASRKSRLLKKFWLLEQDAELLESEMKELMNGALSQQQQQQRKEKEEERASWLISIQRSQHNLVMNTNITNISELFALVQQFSGYYILQHTPPSSISNHTNNQLLIPVTLRSTPFEQVLRKMFSTVKPLTLLTPPPPPPPPSSDRQSLAAVKRDLIDIYFACAHLHNPVLVEPYYHGYMHQHLDDMISWAAAAFVAYTSCHHVKDYFTRHSDWTRHQVGISCEWEAKHRFDQAVLVDWTSEQHHISVSWLFTAYMLTQCALSNLRNKQARLYADAAWRLAILLKETYVPILKKEQAPPQDQELMYAESWRRLYLAARTMDIGLSLANEQCIAVSQMLQHCTDIGFPQPLACERTNKELLDAVTAYRDLTKLHHVAFMGYGERLSLLAFRLYTGKLSSIGAEDLRAIEHRFMVFWNELPTEHRFSTFALDYIDMDRVQRCPSTRVLRVNAIYYVVIMSTMLRIIQQDSNMDPLMDRMNGEHALLVVSICCDALLKIYKVLHLRLPCTIDLHWLSIVLDTVLLLTHVKNKGVRQRAIQGARTARDIFTQYMDRPVDGEKQQQHCTNQELGNNIRSPPSSHDSSSPPLHTTYHDILVQQMDARLADHDSHYNL